MTGDRAGGQLAVPDEQEDLSATRFDDGIEQRLHRCQT
jgi:hypothetical protein